MLPHLPSGMISPEEAPMPEGCGAAGNPLRNSLWNLLYRVVSLNDHSRTAWGAILRGACLAFFKETYDDLPASDNEGARRVLKDLFFGLPDHRVCDLYEFLLTDDRAGMKEVDRKLLRRSLNRVLEEEGAPVRLLRDRFVPLPDELGLDAVMTAGEKLSLFDLDAAARHMHSSVEFLARRPSPAVREAVREAVIAVAAVVRTLVGGSGPVAMGTVSPAAVRLGIPLELQEGINAMLGYCYSVSGLREKANDAHVPDLSEAACLVSFCSSVINLLLEREREKGKDS